MLGTAASNSITKDNDVDSFDGAISVKNMAMPKLIGTPIAIAIPELTKVPIIYGNAPNDSRPSTAFQSLPVKKKNPSCEKIASEPSLTVKITKPKMKRV